MATKWVEHLTDVAARSDCPVIIQVGAFGYFPDHRDGPRFMSAVDQACAANGVELWFIDGNHDDHTSVAEVAAAARRCQTDPRRCPPGP